MPETREDRILEEAIAWTLRLRHADADGWQAFTAWLEADAAHGAAYDEVAELDLTLDGLPARPAPPIAVEPPQERRISRRAVFGFGAAAALAGMIGYALIDSPRATYAMETNPGQRRTVAIADGTTIALNGGTRILLDRDDSRFARLERGEALFSVVSLPSRPFRVEAGGGVIRNVGTVFNVVRQPDLVVVEVAEGAVLFDSGAREVRLAAGMTLRQQGSEITTGRRDATTVGTWREGRLSYSAASFADIARDLSRNTGLAVRASAEVASRRFSGVIMLDGDQEQLRRRVEALLEVEVRRSGEAWTLSPAAR